MVLIDTDILVEFLRGSDAAKTWVRSMPRESFAIPGVVAMELIVGCRDQPDLIQIQKFLSRFNVVWPDQSEFEKAYRLLATHRLASGIGIPDCIIAAMAIARTARLYTFNLKHFRLIPGLEVLQPYPRS